MGDKEQAAILNDSEQAVAAAIAAWLEGLALHRSCPPERRDWYRGVAIDVRHGGPWKAHASYVASLGPAKE